MIDLLNRRVRNSPQYIIFSLLLSLILISAVFLYFQPVNFEQIPNKVFLAIATGFLLFLLSSILLGIKNANHVKEGRNITDLRKLAESDLIIAEEARAKAENFQLLAEKARDLAIEASKTSEDANQTKSDFLANTTHEIRTPMGVIIGLSNLLLSTPLNGKQKEYVDVLKGSAEALIAMVNDLLDLRKIEAHKIELENIPFNPKVLLEQIIGMMRVKAEEKSVRLSFLNEEEADKSFMGDPIHIRQIMINLIGNAIKFTDKGSVEVNIQNEGIKGRKQKLSISVKDTGIGIAPDRIDDVFEKFIQADSSISQRYGGTGLGLSISKAFAEAMDGSITIESELGKGSVFTLHLSLLAE